MAFNQPNVAVGAPVAATLENATLAVLSPATAYAATIANWSSASTPPTTTARYWISGNICHVVAQSKLGTGTISVGAITISLPVPMDITGMIANSTLLNGTAAMSDVSVGSTAYYMGLLRMVDASTVAVLRPSAATPGVFGTTSASLPFTWQTLDELSALFEFPIA